MGITEVIIMVIGLQVIIMVIGLLTYVLSPHDPPSIVRMRSCKHMSGDDSGMFARACK